MLNEVLWHLQDVSPSRECIWKVRERLGIKQLIQCDIYERHNILEKDQPLEIDLLISAQNKYDEIQTQADILCVYMYIF